MYMRSKEVEVKKIIHLVLGKANPQRMNGVNKVAHQLAMHQCGLGKDVEIWGITRTPDNNVYPRPFPTRLFRLQPFYRDLDPNLLYAIAQEDSPCIFHIHGAFIADFYKVTRLLKYKDIPFVYTPHGAFNEVALEKNKWLKKLYLQRYERIMLKEAKRVQFLGQSEYDHISSLVRLNNKVIIPNGQDFKELEFDFHPMHGHERPVFGFCGRLDIYYKGLDFLIEGFASYVKEGGKGELWLIGDGPDRSKLEKQAQDAGVFEKVKFMGAHYGKDKLNRIANMDLFCHPSRSEGSPTAILEAAALQRPVMISTATNIAGPVKSYHSGIHLAANNPIHIKEALHTFEKLYAEGKHEKMGLQAYRMVSEQFDWQRIAASLCEIYEV